MPKRAKSGVHSTLTLDFCLEDLTVGLPMTVILSLKVWT